MTVPEIIAMFCKDASKKIWVTKNYLLVFNDYGDFLIKDKKTRTVLTSMDEEVALEDATWTAMYH